MRKTITADDMNERRHAGAWLGYAGIGLPVVTLAASAAVLVHRVPGLVPHMANSDSVGPMLIAESLGRVPHSTHFTMASEGNYTTLALDVVTRGLPGHRALWETLPILMTLAGVALLTMSVAHLAGWRAAVLTAAITLITAPPLLTPLTSQAYHNTASLNAVVLAAAPGLAGTPR